MFSLLHHARITCKNVAFNLARYAAQPGVEVLKGPRERLPRGPGRRRAVAVTQHRAARGPAPPGRRHCRPNRAQDAAGPRHAATLRHEPGLPRDFRPVLPGHRGLRRNDTGGGTESDLARAGRVPRAHARATVDFAEDLLRETAPMRGSLRAGSTVAHLSFYLAEYLGCDPIILIGQDLSFSDGLYTRRYANRAHLAAGAWPLRPSR